MDMKSLMLSSNLMGKTQGLVPFSGFLEPRASKGGGGEHAVKSQLEPNLVPHKEALSTLIESGACREESAGTQFGTSQGSSVNPNRGGSYLWATAHAQGHREPHWQGFGPPSGVRCRDWV